jgi:hypothetical protein
MMQSFSKDLIAEFHADRMQIGERKGEKILKGSRAISLRLLKQSAHHKPSALPRNQGGTAGTVL